MTLGESRTRVAPAPYTLWVPGDPVPKGSKRGVTYTRADGHLGVRLIESSKAYPAWRDQVAADLDAARLRHRWPVLTGPVSVHLSFYLHKPKRPKHPVFPITKPDIDKLVRAVCDGLTTRLVVDDSQIVELLAFKRYDAEPGVFIRVAPVDG